MGFFLLHFKSDPLLFKVSVSVIQSFSYCHISFAQKASVLDCGFTLLEIHWLFSGLGVDQ